jgi:IS605 OrfB family transposase
MLIRKAYKYRLVENNSINGNLRQQADISRGIWNQALAWNTQRLDRKQPILWYQEMAFWLTLWKKTDELGFLKQGHSQVLQQKLKDLDKAFHDAFDKTQPLKRLPRFKKKYQDDSFRYPQGFKVDGNRVFLPKVGWIGFRKSRAMTGTPKNITVSYKAGHWHISIQCETETSIPVHPSTTAVGIDVGIAKFATVSDGQIYEPLNSFKRWQHKLKQEQQKLSRKKKFSSNWKKQKSVIQRLHSKIAYCRNDYLHKTSTEISKNHAMIIVEDLKVTNMSRSAKGNIEAPGKNVSAKSGLNRSILDQGWGEFRRQLNYKQDWSGGSVIAIPPRHTSQCCSACGHTEKANRKTQEIFHCQECDHTENADLNAAKNILAAGHAVMACESNPIRGRKQELVEDRKAKPLLAA